MDRRLFGWLGLLMVLVSVGHAAPLGSSFTYQGELNVSDQPADGIYDFEIALYSVSSGGLALDTATHGDVSVDRGLFAVTLDYTDVPFASSTQYFLELRVRDGASAGAYTTLLPRQPIHATPYAQHAKSVDASAIVGAAAARPVYSDYAITLPGVSPTAGDSSITVGVDGLPIASIHDSANGNLVALHCDDPGCTQRTMTTLDSIGNVGRGNSIFVASNGLPAISYIDSTNGALKMARCTNTRCTAAALFVVDPAVGDSRRSVIMSAASSTPGTADIVYRDEIQGDVESATCSPTGSCTFATIDSANNVGRALDAIRFGRLIFVAYSDETAGSLRLKTCFGLVSSCTGSSADNVDAAGVATDVALVAPPDGRLLITYIRGTDLRTARCTSPQCTASTLGPVIDSGESAVAALLGGDGLPVMISLSSDYSFLSMFKCADPGCATAFVASSSSSSPGVLDAKPALTLGAHGYPVVTHRLASFLDLWVCDSPECSFARRR